MSAEVIYQLVAQIPPGKVATYGQIARLAGLGRGARMVGRTLKLLPNDTLLPWHRVVNSRGTISLPPESDAYAEQKDRLEQDGVHFTRNRVNLRIYGWDPV